MKLKTVRVRRSRPSPPALALALLVTMACVYLLSLSVHPDESTDTAAAQTQGSADIRMEGMNAFFLTEAHTSNQLEARILAARCAEHGGAGLVLAEQNGYAVIHEAVSPGSADGDVIQRSCSGLTLKLEGSAMEITAVSDTVDFLRTQAAETGGLASALEGGGTDAQSIRSLLHIYYTEGSRAVESLGSAAESNPVAARLASAAEAALDRLDSAISEPDAGKIKLIHAAACAEWISISEEFVAGA